MPSRDRSAVGSRVDACELECPWLCTLGGSLARAELLTMSCIYIGSREGVPLFLGHVAPGEITGGANPRLRVEIAYPQGHISATGHQQTPFRANVDRNDVAAVRRDSSHQAPWPSSQTRVVAS